MPYKRNKFLRNEFLASLKNVSRETEKNPNFVYPELRYLEKKISCKNFFGKCFFSEKLDLRLKKKQKKIGQFQFYF